MEYFPCEIFLNIFSRLPVTSLLQCKLVCRAWKHLAEDPLLVNMHFSRTAEYDPVLILQCDFPVKNQLYSLELTARDQHNHKVNKIWVPQLPEFDVVGSCKGLLCLCDSATRSSLFIYNPFIRDYTKLPKPITFPNQEGVFGFGFHPLTEEFKVVKISYFKVEIELDAGEIIPPKAMVQVLTLSSPGWRSLGKLPYFPLQRPSTPSQVLVNGRLHWLTKPQTNATLGAESMLISFDLADEQFRFVPKPDSVVLGGNEFSAMVVGGCLSFAVRPYYSELKIWVMKEYDVKESWTMKYRIGLRLPRGLEQDLPESFRRSKFYNKTSFVRVLCLLKNGHILLQFQGRSLVSYDPTNGTYNDLLFHGLPNWFEAVVHEGNLTTTQVQKA